MHHEKPTLGFAYLGKRRQDRFLFVHQVNTLYTAPFELTELEIGPELDTFVHDTYDHVTFESSYPTVDPERFFNNLHF